MVKTLEKHLQTLYYFLIFKEKLLLYLAKIISDAINRHDAAF